MISKKNQIASKLKRKPFRDAVRIFMKCNGIAQNSIAKELGLTKQEFSNLLSGYQDSVPNKGINTYMDFEVKVINLLGSDFTQGNIQY